MFSNIASLLGRSCGLRILLRARALLHSSKKATKKLVLNIVERLAFQKVLCLFRSEKKEFFLMQQEPEVWP